MFANVNCSAIGLCNDTSIDEIARKRICFGLPCAIIEGTLNVGQCQGVESIAPSSLSFPEPVRIQNIKLTPRSVELNGENARLCFTINELDVTLGVALNLNTTGTNLTDTRVGIHNVNPILDGPREACVSAKINLRSSTPVTELKIETPSNAPFVSDDMIRAASSRLRIDGITGYPAADIAAVQNEIAPVIFQPLRDTVETAVKDALGQVFQTQINAIAGAGSKQSMSVESSSMMSEFGISNFMVTDQLAITECAALSAAGRPIPPDHACIGLNDIFEGPITTAYKGRLSSEIQSLNRASRGLNVTSESIKQRLIALREVVLARRTEFLDGTETPEELQTRNEWTLLDANLDINDYLNPIVEQISTNQLRSQLPSMLEIHNSISSDGLGRDLAIALPGVCTDRASPHANRSIPNCPVQVYADLNEFNILLQRMWESGRLCQSGSGRFRQDRDEYNQPKYNEEGAPVGTGGCAIESDGMLCYMKAPPQLSWDTATRKYKTKVSLESCYRGPAFLGLGRFGGDFDINMAFSPAACDNGDFCVQNPDVNWNVVPGSGRFALRESSLFHEVVNQGLNDAIVGSLSNGMRLPLSSGTGPLGLSPLVSEGRVDAGPGYFGACLKPKEGSAVPE